MAFNLKKAFEGGHINVFQLDDGNHVLVLAGATRGFVVPLLFIKGQGNKGFFQYPTDLDPSQQLALASAINDYVVNSLKSCYQGLPAYSQVITGMPTPKHSNIVKSALQPTKSLNQADDALVEKYLTDAGYDVTALKCSMKTALAPRDYTKQLATDQGKKLYDENEKELNDMGVEWDDYDFGIKQLALAIKNRKLNGAIFVGEAGTGKSVLAQAIGRYLKAPVRVFQYSGGTKEEDLIGSYKPCGNSGGFERFEGFLSESATKGYVLVGNEVNFSKDEIQSIHNQYLDENINTITIDGVDYPKDPNFVLLLTMNASYQGTEELNQALKSRFAKVVLEPIDADTFSKRLNIYSKKQGNELSIPFFRKLYDIAKTVQAAAAENNEDAAICIRNGKTLVSLITNKPLNEKEFLECFHIAYSNEVSFEGGDLVALKNFKKSIEKDVKDLYALYNYRNVEKVTVTEEILDLLQEEAPKEGKSTMTEKDAEELSFLDNDMSYDDKEANDLFNQLGQEEKEDNVPVPDGNDDDKDDEDEEGEE